MTLTLDNESVRFELPDLQGRNLTLEYPGATPADEANIEAAGGIEHVQPYRVQVEPRLYADGQLLATFTALNPGTRQRLEVRVTVPEGDPAIAVQHPVAGGMYALLVNGGKVTAPRVDALRAATAGLSGVALVRAQVLLAVSWWARENEENNTRLFALQNHEAFEDVTVALAGRQFEAQFQFGIPVALSRGSYVLHVTRYTLTPLPKDGDESLVPNLVLLAGHQSSFLEGKAWEETLSTAAISAVRIVQAARAELIPVYVLTTANAIDRGKLIGYSALTLSDVDQALAAGWRVTIPERPLNYLSFQNVEGYILQNPVDGSAFYMIGGTLHGSVPGGNPASVASADAPSCGCDEPTVGSTIDMARGIWRETWTDLMLPAVGLPVVWGRTYSSRATGLTELGYGWMHSYGMHLRAEPNGDRTYVTEDWRQVRFAKTGADFTPPPGWPITLAAIASGHRLRMKDGLTYDFDNGGKLVSIAEPSGNRIDLVYVAGLLFQVKDSDGRVALTFTHAGNKISAVTDRAGRTVSYAHVGDDLVRATDVLGHSEAYAYDGTHNLVKRIDKLGNPWLNFYDFQDRWVGNRDPLGHEAAAAYDFVNRRSVYIDKTGAAWKRVHNAAGNPTALVDPLGNRVEYAWDGKHNKLQEKDGRSFVTKMTYDGKGNLLSRTEPDGRVLTWLYEPDFSRVQSQTATELRTVTMTYDAAGRIRTRADGLGTTSYNYDARGKLTAVTAPGNATTGFAYDGFGDVQTLTDATNRSTTMVYDGAGHLTSTTDGNGKTRSLEVDPAGRVTATVDATGARTEFTYDAVGKRTSVKDAGGHVTMFRYDAAGRVVETEDAIAHVTKTQYDAEGRAVAVTDARGFVTKTRYDRAGRIVETEAADGGKTTLAYCADVGTEPCCAIDALGNITKKEFDAAGRVTKVTDALGQVAVTTYDTAGRMKSTSGPGQVPTTYGYGSNGLLSSMVQPLTTINYGYDVRGSRTTVEAHGQVTTFTYDLANRLLTETNPIGKVTSSFAYDPTGNRQTKTDGNGKVTTYSYDGNRRLTEVQFADDTKYEYAYDARGNRTLERSPSHTRTLAYDELGRLTTVDDVTLGRAIQYAYDELGNRISVQEGALLHAYAYDAMGRLKRATAPGAAAEFDYDAVGRRTLVSRSNGVVTNYGYDAVGQVLNIVHSTGGAVLASFAYQYDNGNRTVKEYADGTKEAYEYDGNDRLTRVAYGTSRVVSYNLDPLGNWNNLDDVEQSPQGRRSTFRSSTFNPFNQILSADTFCQGPPDVCPPGSATKYTYDGNGNLLAETTGPAVKRYEWDLDNRLRGVTHPSGTVSTYDYDANGLRTRKMEAGVTTRYLLDGPSVLEELDSSGGLMTGYLTNPQVIDEILSFTTGNAVYWPLSDALGSIYTVANSTGAVVRSYSYDVYGQRVSIGPGPSITFGFTGREHDAATALNYHRDRYKAPTSGRWTQPDRLGAAEGLNAYQYAGTNPVIFADPTGLCRDPGGPGVRFCISAFIPTTFLASRGNPFLKTGFGDSRGPDPTGGSFRIQQTIQLIGGTAIQQFEVAWSRGLPIPGITGALPLIGIPGTSPFNYANLSGGILDAIGTGHSEMAGLIANAGTITYEFQIPVDTRIIRFFCGRVPIVSGERTNYPSFEVWMYQDGAMPTLLYQYDAKMAGAAVEDLHSSTWIPGLGGR